MKQPKPTFVSSLVRAGSRDLAALSGATANMQARLKVRYAKGEPMGMGLEKPKATTASAHIVLGWPPSANRYWHTAIRGGRAVTYLTPEGKAYKSQAYALCAEAGLRPLDGDVRVTAHMYRPAKRGDIDNFWPLCADSLNGRAYHDDKQIAELHLYRHDDKGHPRVVVQIERMET